jgi:hypothetical protein
MSIQKGLAAVSQALAESAVSASENVGCGVYVDIGVNVMDVAGAGLEGSDTESTLGFCEQAETSKTTNRVNLRKRDISLSSHAVDN